MFDLKRLGESVWVATFAEEASARRWATAVEAMDWTGLTDVVAAYKSVGVFFDATASSGEEIDARLRSLTVPNDSDVPAGRLHCVPVLYDGADLESSAESLGMTPAELIERHARVEYVVHALGFQPGFPYLGYLEPPLDRIPRRASPRLKVPAGSVAFASGQTGIYPAELPGGWNLLGRTPSTIVDVRSGYFPIAPGDRIRFEPIDEATFEARRGERL